MLKQSSNLKHFFIFHIRGFMYFLYIMLLLSFTLNSIAATTQMHIPNLPHNDPQSSLSTHDIAWLQEIIGSENDVNNAANSGTEQKEIEDTKSEEIDDELINIIFEANPDLNKIIERFKVAKQRNDNAFKLAAILFVGEPGTGKTFAARAVAKKLDADFEFIATPNAGTPFQNSASNNLERQIKCAQQRSKKEHLVILLDEINGLINAEKQEHRADSDPGLALNIIMDNDIKKKCIFIGTANDITKLPKSLRNRFDQLTVQFNKFDTATKKKLFAFFGKDDLSEEMTAYAAKKTPDYMSIRNFQNVTTWARFNAIKRESDTVSQQDMDAGIADEKKSMNHEQNKSWMTSWVPSWETTKSVTYTTFEIARFAVSAAPSLEWI